MRDGGIWGWPAYAYSVGAVFRGVRWFTVMISRVNAINRTLRRTTWITNEHMADYLIETDTSNSTFHIPITILWPTLERSMRARIMLDVI
ncbi:hypothetical protein Tco_0615036 [Tanacetum coccineum]